MPMVNSATGMVGASGVLVTVIPKSLAALISTESMPIPQREMLFSLGEAASSTLAVRGSTPASKA